MAEDPIEPAAAVDAYLENPTVKMQCPTAPRHLTRGNARAATILASDRTLHDLLQPTNQNAPALQPEPPTDQIAAGNLLRDPAKEPYPHDQSVAWPVPVRPPIHGLEEQSGTQYFAIRKRRSPPAAHRITSSPANREGVALPKYLRAGPY